MKKAEVRVTINYVSRTSPTNCIDIILTLPIDFTEKDIADRINEIKYCAKSYSFKEIEVLSVYDDED